MGRTHRWLLLGIFLLAAWAAGLLGLYLKLTGPSKTPEPAPPTEAPELKKPAPGRGSGIRPGNNRRLASPSGAASRPAEAGEGRPLIWLARENSDQAVPVGQSAEFTALWSDPDGLQDVREVTWDFGDASPAENAEPAAGTESRSHAFASAGAFTVRVTARDWSGNAATAEHAVAVGSGRAPGVKFSAASDIFSAVPGQAVNLGAQWSDPDGLEDVESVTWTWGDGSPPQRSAPHLGKDLQSHRFDAPGFYAVSIVASDRSGETATADIMVNVAPPGAGPAAVILEPGEGAAAGRGGRVKLVARWTDPDGLRDLDSWTVDWGDGSPEERFVIRNAYRSSAEHAFSGEGRYEIRVTVTDKAGQRFTASRWLTVR